jgi:hypothetical protein
LGEDALVVKLAQLPLDAVEHLIGCGARLARGRVSVFLPVACPLTA